MSSLVLRVRLTGAMAKSGFLQMMQAKPNARGRRSHLPIRCSVGKCEEDFLVSVGKEYPPKRYCTKHAPFIKTSTEDVELDAMLSALGLVA